MLLISQQKQFLINDVKNNSSIALTLQDGELKCLNCLLKLKGVPICSSLNNYVYFEFRETINDPKEEKIRKNQRQDNCKGNYSFFLYKDPSDSDELTIFLQTKKLYAIVFETENIKNKLIRVYIDEKNAIEIRKEINKFLLPKNNSKDSLTAKTKK